MDDSSEQARTLYCGNLSEETTEEILYELCLQVGPIDKISIPTSNGKRRNFGFVTFKHAVSVPYAIKLLSEETLFKRKIVFRARGQTSDSPKNSPNNDDRRNPTPDVSIIQDKRRSSHHSPSSLLGMPPNFSQGLNRQHFQVGNSSPCVQIPQSQYQNFSPLPNQLSPHIFVQNRFSNWK